ncbi:unnamed protein product, partial [marine sediment metagenome]
MSMSIRVGLRHMGRSAVEVPWKYPGWDPHYWGTYGKDADIDAFLIEEGLWNAVVGT